MNTHRLLKWFHTLGDPNRDSYSSVETLELTALRKWHSNNRQNQLRGSFFPLLIRTGLMSLWEICLISFAWQNHTICLPVIWIIDSEEVREDASSPFLPLVCPELSESSAQLGRSMAQGCPMPCEVRDVALSYSRACTPGLHCVCHCQPRALEGRVDAGLTTAGPSLTSPLWFSGERIVPSMIWQQKKQASPKQYRSRHGKPKMLVAVTWVVEYLGKIKRDRMLSEAHYLGFCLKCKHQQLGHRIQNACVWCHISV